MGFCIIPVLCRIFINTSKEFRLKLLNSLCWLFFITLFSLQDLYALPMDFGGELGFDSIRVSNYRRTKDSTSTVANGSEAIEGSGDSAYIQTYLFKLKPSMIINDHVTMRGEVTTGSGRGGNLGEGSYNASNEGKGHTHYFHTTPNNNSANNLNVNQLYIDVYSETATYRIGRFAKHWGLGALINGGDKSWDRFFTYYEGAEAIFSLGKLYITPSWSNISNNDVMTHSGEIKDIALSLLYDNPDKDMKFGIYLGKRSTNGNSIYQTRPDDSPTGTLQTLTNSDSNLLDLFMSRYFGNFYLGVEVPYVYGELGNVNGVATDFKGLAVLVQSSYEFNERWTTFAHFGKVDGDEGKRGTFNAVYLHPNYQVAELMFRYNFDAVSDGTENIFESSITNAMFLKLGATYKKNLWSWNMAWIYGKADQTASNGSRAFNHSQGYHFTGAANQKDDLGHEIDVSFDYQWNPNLVLSGVGAYYMVGDYYAFTNSTTELSLSNQMAAGLKLNLKF
jgi:hypothetical protein